MPGLWAGVREALRQTNVIFLLLRAGLTCQRRPGGFPGAEQGVEVRNLWHIDLLKELLNKAIPSAAVAP